MGVCPSARPHRGRHLRACKRSRHIALRRHLWRFDGQRREGPGLHSQRHQRTGLRGERRQPEHARPHRERELRQGARLQRRGQERHTGPPVGKDEHREPVVARREVRQRQGRRRHVADLHPAGAGEQRQGHGRRWSKEGGGDQAAGLRPQRDRGSEVRIRQDRDAR